MFANYFSSLQSEWIKRKHSTAAWLIIAGSFFIPFIILLKRIINYDSLQKANESPHLWDALYNECWQYMAFFLLPMGIVLVTSLITQLEYRNNGWKQLHTTPQKFSVIFFAKLSIIIIALVQFFILFTIGIYLVGVLPALFFNEIPYPQQSFPIVGFLSGNGKFFIASLPVLALQYLFSIHFKNFIVSIGIGFALLIASLIAVQWQYGYLIPYTYCPAQFLKRGHAGHPPLYMLAMGYFLLFTLINYVLYITKKTKG